MKKNIFSVLVMLLALCCLIVGCDNPANSNTNTETSDNEKISTGWYKFTKGAQNDFPELRAVLIYINNEGKVERVGNEVWEYENTALTYFKTTYAELSSKDIRDGFFQPTTAPNYQYLTVKNNEKLDAGWYSYLIDNRENYTYITSKGTVTVAGDTERFDSTAMEELYHFFYPNQTSITKTENGFILTLGEKSMDFSLTENTPEWCSNFNFL